MAKVTDQNLTACREFRTFEPRPAKLGDRGLLLGWRHLNNGSLAEIGIGIYDAAGKPAEVALVQGDPGLIRSVARILAGKRVEVAEVEPQLKAYLTYGIREVA